MVLPLLVTKVIVLAVLLVSTFLCSMLPLLCMSVLLHQSSSSRRLRFDGLMSLLSCFAAGVFLATCLLDLFPDVQEKLSDYMDQAQVMTAYPVAEFIMTCGLFLILIVEQMVLTFSGNTAMVVEDREPLLSEDGSCNDDHNHLGHSQVVESNSDSDNTSQTVSFRTNRSAAATADDGSPDNGCSQEAGWSHPQDSAEEHHYTGRAEEEVQNVAYQDPSSRSPVRTLILLAALSLHSVFEGLAVGLQDTAAQVLQIFAALALHKSIIAFSLGLNLSQSRLSIVATIRSNLLFSITSPLGIGIGIAIMDLTSADSQAALLANVILQGLACGTFLYIVFFEVLPHEFNSPMSHPSRLLKVLFLVLGYGTVAMLLFIYPSVARPVCQKSAHSINQ